MQQLLLSPKKYQIMFSKKLASFEGFSVHVSNQAGLIFFQKKGEYLAIIT